MLFETCSCDMYLLHSYVHLQISKSFQIPFNPFSNNCLSKIRVKTWVEEPYIGELHVYLQNLEINYFHSITQKKQEPKTMKEKLISFQECIS